MRKRCIVLVGAFVSAALCNQTAAAEPLVEVWQVRVYFRSPTFEVPMNTDDLRSHPPFMYFADHLILDYGAVADALADQTDEQHSVGNCVLVLDLSSPTERVARVSFVLDSDGIVSANGLRLGDLTGFVRLLDTVSPQTPFSKWFPSLSSKESSSAANGEESRRE